MNFIFTYHPVWLLLVAFIAVLASLWLYYRAKEWQELHSNWRWLLAIFRFVTVFCIGLLLLGIIFENLNEKTQKPIVFLLQDHSESVVQTKDSVFYKTTFLENMSKLSTDLEGKFEVVRYGFSDKISPSIDTGYSYKLTNISQALEQIYDQYANRNLGAIVLATDGIYNSGQNPVYTINRKPNLPVFTIGLGDTNVRKDALVENVVNNDIAFLGNDFPVQIQLSQNGYNGETVKVEVFESNRLLKSKTVNFNNANSEANIDFLLEASSPGYKKYTVKITKLKGEFTYRNNEKNFYINVIDGRQKILLTYSHVHPDISSLNYVIEKNKNYDLTVLPVSELKGSLTMYDLIIVHNYQKGSAELDEIIKTNSIPTLQFVGVNADLTFLSSANIGLKGAGGRSEDIVFEGNINFKDIIFEPPALKLLGSAPPLTSPQGNINFSESVKTIAYQKIGNITLSKPLIYTNEKGDNKYAVILGEGIWRWRLHDQKLNESTDDFANFFNQLLTYLAVKENKDPFKINIEKEYEESDEVVVRAELYNASYQLTNESEVMFKLIDEDNTVLNYSFFNSNESYILELGRLEQGIYQWEANTVLEGKKLFKKGTFIVKETKREVLNLTANHRLLNHLSVITNGRFFFPNQLGELEALLKNREDIVSITYQEKNFRDIIEYKWLFVLIFISLIAEWFIRKYQGGY